jgi:hypothetical protein
VKVDEFLTKELQRESLTLRSKLSATGTIENMPSLPNRSSSGRSTKIDVPSSFFLKVSNI